MSQACLSVEECFRKVEKLKAGWNIQNGFLEKTFAFKDFKDALAFVNKVGDLAEKEKHHPDLILSYNKLKMRLWTHDVEGLTERDFLLAEKMDRLH